MVGSYGGAAKLYIADATTTAWGTLKPT